MSNQKLVILLTKGTNNDVSSVAFTIANAALGKGMEVGIFLTSDGVDLSRENGSEYTHVAPFKTLKELITGFLANGGTLWTCAPCFNHHGLNPQETYEGSEVVGAGPMLEWIAAGAKTLSF
ncbi:MAG: DsrE family protein [Bacteroidota bacterium]